MNRTGIRALSGIEDEALRSEMEYYATQLQEVDDFLRALTAVLDALDELTVLLSFTATTCRV